MTSVLLLGFELALPLTTSYFVDNVLPGRVHGQLAVLSAGLGLLCLMFALLQLARSFLVVRQQAYLEKRLTVGVMGKSQCPRWRRQRCHRARRRKA